MNIQYWLTQLLSGPAADLTQRPRWLGQEGERPEDVFGLPGRIFRVPGWILLLVLAIGIYGRARVFRR